MGCNCGKNKRTLAQTLAEQAKTPQANQQSTQGQTTPPPAPKTSAQQSFSLRLNSGQVMRFGSRLEAEAENVRRGYTGTVKPI